MKTFYAVLFILSACTTEVVDIDAADVDVPDRALCTFYEWLGDRDVAPFTSPEPYHVVVDALIDPLYGARELRDDGTTFVWQARTLHYADGTVDIGAVGRPISPIPNQVENPAWCQWYPAIEIVVDAP